MGADLFITSIRDRKTAMYAQSFEQAVRMRDSLKPPYNEEYQELVESYYNKMFRVGYFRDSYNHTNLLWRFKLDYWSKSWKIDANGCLPPSEAKRLLKLLKQREWIFEESLERIRKEGWAESPDEIILYFRLKYLRLRVFLRMAIKLNEPIIWWV